MPQLTAWRKYFESTVDSIASSLKNQFPEGIDREKLEAIEEKINALWLSETSTVREFQEAVGEWKMLFFNARKDRS